MAQKVKGWGIKMNLKQLESLVFVLEEKPTDKTEYTPKA